MTRAAFAMAIGGNPAWITNTTRILGRRIPRTDASARAFALIHMLQTECSLSLPDAEHVARWALREPATASVEIRRSSDGSTTLTLDLPRFHSTFNARLATARSYGAPAARGRRRVRGRDAVAAAAAYGVDISLLRSNLRRTPAQRLAALNENMALVRELRSNR